MELDSFKILCQGMQGASFIGKNYIIYSHIGNLLFKIGYIILSEQEGIYV